MVTMAKGIGNGFPMGAVVTTPGENKKPYLKISLKMYVSFFSDLHKLKTATTDKQLYFFIVAIFSC